jgi:hypothetical protein
VFKSLVSQKYSHFFSIPSNLYGIVITEQVSIFFVGETEQDQGGRVDRKCHLSSAGEFAFK